MPGEGKEDSNRAINGDARRNTTDNSNSGGQQNRRAVATTLAQEMMIDTEEAVMANFDFLSSEVFKVYFNLHTINLWTLAKSELANQKNAANVD